MAAVRRATQADAPALAKMLARAFDDDPVAEWVSPHGPTRARMLERFHAARLRHMLPHGEVWMTEDGGGAAVWAPPEQGATTVRHELELFRAVTKPRTLARLPRIQKGMSQMEKEHPHDPPHYYLAVVGTEPQMQGRGLGTATLEPVLAQCDEDGDRRLPRVLQGAQLPRG